MIFVTVGTQLPFDRLIRSVEEALPIDFKGRVIAQTNSDINITRFDCRKNLNAQEFDELIEQADIVISHAGMGTILTCLSKQKPILVMPRLEKYNEHRNDHQQATCNNLAKQNGICVVNTSDDIANMLLRNNVNIGAKISEYANDEFILNLRNEILNL